MALKFLPPIHQAIRQISLYFEENGRESGLTAVESHMLAYLYAYQPAAISELHRVFGTKPSTLTSQLDRMERQGLITRSIAPDDRRSFLITLTKDGEATAGHIEKNTRSLERRIRTRVSVADIDGFKAVIQAISQATGIEVRSKKKEAIK